jgi:hypothetical protein
METVKSSSPFPKLLPIGVATSSSPWGDATSSGRRAAPESVSGSQSESGSSPVLLPPLRFRFRSRCRFRYRRVGQGQSAGLLGFPPCAGSARHFAAGVLLGIGIDSEEGPSACSPYPGGISAASPGSRSAPRVHVENGNNPGGVEGLPTFAPRRGADSITTRLSPGACFARTGAIGSHPSGMPARWRRGSGSGIDETRKSPWATIASDFFGGLDFWRQNLSDLQIQPWLVYGGDTRQDLDRATVHPWRALDSLLDAVAGGD